jgi:arsenate reductase
LLKIYTYKGCSTCKKAVKHLKDEGVAFTEVPIREQPPTVAELKSMLAAYDGNIRKLFNTSGGDYREMGLGAKIDSLPEKEALDLLHGNGNLVKRPFALAPGVHLVGFEADTWKQALKR